MFSKKNKKRNSCPGQKYFIWGFFIIFFIYYLLIFLEKIPENYIPDFIIKNINY